MHFLKVQGTGNDFVLIDGREVPERDWPKLAVAMCDRHFGVGADGILLVLPSKVADVRMRIFNADGSEAEMCGNGVRCVARYAIERGLAGPDLSVETLAGIMRIQARMHDGVLYSLRVNMGRPRLTPQEIPIALEAERKSPMLNYPLAVGGHVLALSFVSMGNPHAIHFLDDDPDAFPLEQVGPLVERHPLFPRRTNFEVVQVPDRSHMKVCVWERGAGITLACGTGACAAMVAARLLGLVDERAEVAMSGGVLELEWGSQGDVYMSGPAEVVFEGEWTEVVG